MAQTDPTLSALIALKEQIDASIDSMKTVYQNLREIDDLFHFNPTISDLPEEVDDAKAKLDIR